MNFESLGLSKPLLKALKSCGYEAPTPIQMGAIPPALEGRDVLGCAQTGTGKTCAFGTPILQMLSQKPRKSKAPRALILTPTRELAIQIGDNLRAYSKELPLRTAVIFGGVGQSGQVQQIRQGIDVLTATPGRLMDLHQQGLINLKDVEIFVLDEADRMLDMGFIHDVRKILTYLPKEKQTLFFSATMPKEITELVDSLLTDPVRIEVDPVSSPVELIDQKVYFVDRKNKIALLADIIREDKVKNALLFVRTKHGADKVTKELMAEGISAAAIHGNKSQSVRQYSLAQFKRGKVKVLVATDIAARGIDIDHLSHVFNYNLPDVPETYVHRIGRTGRAGRDGTAISFCDNADEAIFKRIEKLLGRQITRVEDHPYPMQVVEPIRRDSKGRIIHPDDEEARSAAREKRAEEKEREKNKKPKGQSGIIIKERRRDKEEPKMAEKAKETGRSGKEQREDRPRKTQRDLPRRDRSLDAPKNEQGGRKNPLDGDVIMDATARLLAAAVKKVNHKGEAVSEGRGDSKNRSPWKRNERPERPERKVENPKIQENREEKPQKEKKTGDKAQNNKPKRGLPFGKTVNKPAPKDEQRGEKKADNKPENKNTGKKIYSRHGHAVPEGKQPRRRMPQPPPPSRSHQKDSTEQPSLMKPFYLNND